MGSELDSYIENDNGAFLVFCEPSDMAAFTWDKLYELLPNPVLHFDVVKLDGMSLQ